MPRARTPRTASRMWSKVRPAGAARQDAPMQNRVEPAAFASRAWDRISSSSISGSRLKSGGVVQRLGAVFAVLRAGACANGQQTAKLHFAGVVVGPVCCRSLEHQIEERLFVKPFDVVSGNKRCNCGHGGFDLCWCSVCGTGMPVASPPAQGGGRATIVESASICRSMKITRFRDDAFVSRMAAAGTRAESVHRVSTASSAKAGRRIVSSRKLASQELRSSRLRAIT